MTTFNKSTLQNLWINGFNPQGSDYTNLIASQVNIAETATQAMAGALSTTKLIAPKVSATNVNITGILSAANIKGAAAQFTSVSGATSLILEAGTFLNVNVVTTFNVSAPGGINLNAPTTVSGLTCTTDVSATSGTVYASAARIVNGIFSIPIIISALGTSLATAAPVTAIINRIQGITDGQTTGVKLQSGRLGLAPQYIINETATSANLWPAGSDFKINALASGAAFAMAANTTYIVIYSQNSAYAVK